MEIKKSFKADLRNKRGLLLEIGLVVALSLVIVAFTYTPDEYRIQKVAVDVMPVDVDIVPVTTDSPKQKPQKYVLHFYKLTLNSYRHPTNAFFICVISVPSTPITSKRHCASSIPCCTV